MPCDVSVCGQRHSVWARADNLCVSAMVDPDDSGRRVSSKTFQNEGHKMQISPAERVSTGQPESPVFRGVTPSKSEKPSILDHDNSTNPKKNTGKG